MRAVVFAVFAALVGSNSHLAVISARSGQVLQGVPDLPLYAAVERIPDSYLEASADLGGRSWRTFRTVVLPLVLPGVVAGSIFTFSLTLGDFITPELVGGPSSRFIGNVVADNTGSNLPLSAAFATVPMLVMAAYLFAAKRAGAFEAL